MSSYEKLKQLGWLSSYARQTLLTRHLARRCVHFSNSALNSPALSLNRQLLLQTLKLCTLCPPHSKKAAARLAAPYYPEDKPEVFLLKSKSKVSNLELNVGSLKTSGTTLSLSEGYDPLAYDFPNPHKEPILENPSASAYSNSAPSDGTDHLDTYLFSEILHVGKGVNLSTKALADTRCEQLWATGLFDNDSLPDAAAQFIKFLMQHPEDRFLSIFLTWFRSLVRGDIDWELWQKISEVSEKTWRAGSETVALEIERIQAELLSGRAPQSETVVFDEAEGKFHLEYAPSNKPDLLGATLDQISDALDDAVSNPSNGLHERSRETKVLQRAAAKYGNNPQRLEMDFTSIHASLARQITSEELPPSEENLALLSAIEQGAQGIRATHPDIAENRNILTKRAIKELPAEALEDITLIAPLLEEISAGELAEDFVEDAKEISEREQEDQKNRLISNHPRNPAFIARDEKVRFFSRTAKIGLAFRKTPDLIQAIDKSSPYKAARIGQVLEAIWRLINWGIGLL
jgi:hypothetical protein